MMQYGFFCGGDPRLFHPDTEASTPEEIENHKRACKIWDETEANGGIPIPEECPSEWLTDDKGNRIVHVLRAPYGMGSYETKDEEF